MFEADLRPSSIYLLALDGDGILLGAWTQGPRLVQAISDGYTSLRPGRSMAALIPAFLVVQLAIVLGTPILFNRVMIANIVGSGLAAGSSGRSGASPRKVGITIGSRVGSVLGTGVISYDLYLLLNAVPIMG